MPFGLNLPVGAQHGAGTVVLHEGVKMLQIPLWRSYFAGCILLGIAPCTAMVLVWGYLARGNDGLTLVMVAINSLTIFWISIPLFLQTIFIFGLGYGASKILKFKYHDAAPVAMIGASNHFEVAIATAVMLFGLSSGAALATVVGVLIEVPVMLMLVGFCKRTVAWFE
jgi:ACR3 family arsenite efflux pump ArsB